ncbi:MAG: hypothetical protein R3240_00320 [Gammaproteobacteria bacterium]|nr:hypothetical protein [Gammaproteobacteria bacterium]
MKRTIQALTLLLVAVALVACGTTGDLNKMKKDYNNGDFAKVISREVKCKDDDKGCNQIHLLRGNACYQLGKKEKTTKYYDCAITHLEKGIKLTSDWDMGKFNLNRDQNYINLCESIRERQDLSKGEEAEQYTRRLLKTSEDFVSVAPENLAAIYFKNSAKFTLLRKPILSAPDDPQVCGAIRGIVTSLKAVNAKAQSSPYAENYSRLISDVESVKPMLVNCQ